MIDFPIAELLYDSICMIWLEGHLYPEVEVACLGVSRVAGQVRRKGAVVKRGLKEA
jgi:hypothetical protein